MEGVHWPREPYNEILWSIMIQAAGHYGERLFTMGFTDVADPYGWVVLQHSAVLWRLVMAGRLRGFDGCKGAYQKSVSRGNWIECAQHFHSYSQTEKYDGAWSFSFLQICRQSASSGTRMDCVQHVQIYFDNCLTYYLLFSIRRLRAAPSWRNCRFLSLNMLLPLFPLASSRRLSSSRRSFLSMGAEGRSRHLFAFF